ncbi:TRAP transporter TatT component family protein [Ahniella affigens]|nr:TRAP transporter TatT component family protein [Ahniella affigens]
MVRSGLPAYVLLIDGFIRGEPDSATMLLAGARLYSAYAGGFVSDADRGRMLADIGLDYARRGLCADHGDFCVALNGSDFDAFQTELGAFDADDIGPLYTLASSYAAWVQADTSDFARIAELPRIEALLKRVAELDRGYDHGNALAYLGVMNCLRPESLGGKPETGKALLQEAFTISGQKNQMSKVLEAQFCARLLFDQELHDGLLNQVLAADPVADDLTLSNVLAQDRAKQLMESGKDYF